ncbi:MAG: hypothetical protein HWE07_14045 [Cytophagia bacterium]|nr:hypothetical protein [Cytophagia bacterium]
MSFICFLYKNTNDLLHNDNDTSFEMSFFKAYLCHVQQLTSDYKITQDTTDKLDWFRKNTWPSLVNQIHSNTYLNPFDSFIKGLIFLNYFRKHPEFSGITKEFLTNVNAQTPWQYLFQILQAASSAWDKKRGNNFKQFFLKYDTPLFSQFFGGMTLPKKPSSEYLSMDFYSLIKSKPLFELTNDSFLVLDWDFLVNKLYDGLVYDFYSNSKISSSKFSGYVDFKRFTSVEITEKQTLKKIITSIFPKASFIGFDEGSGGPDAYVRTGKYVFIFEIKDAYFSSKAILSKDYDAIKAEIDKKYNTRKSKGKKNKGVWQLIDAINHCKKGSFEHKSFEEQRLKRRNLVFYPILIYTDKTFSVPGIDQYLIEEFDNGIQELSLPGVFQQIKTLSFIRLDFFLDNLHLLSHKETSLKFFVDQYIKRRNKLHKSLNEENLFEANDPFEHWIKIPKDQKEMNIRSLANTFDLL